MVSDRVVSPSHQTYHVPVLLAECLDLLSIRSDGIYVDATLGGGGHAKAILERLGPDGRLIGIDQDADALKEAALWGQGFGDRFEAVQTNFEDLAEALQGRGPVDGFLFDLGVSSHQLDAPERGFSFRAGGPLNMRMDGGSGDAVSDILETWSADDLTHAIGTFGEERYAGRIARAIVRERGKLATTADLAELIRKTVPWTPGPERIHPATRTFQALRIVVNREMDVLPAGLRAAVNALRPGGRIVVIAYHSLEDRIVKDLFREQAAGCICPPRLPVCACGHEPSLKILTKKPVRPAEEEQEANPRSRSAKLRAAERLPTAGQSPAA